jgi:hypothetical protein
MSRNRETSLAAMKVASITTTRENDCAIWNLATFLSVPYEEVLVAAARLDKDAGSDGLYLWQMVRMAAKLGVKLRRTRRCPNLETGVGILSLIIPGFDRGHVAILRKGQILCVLTGHLIIWDAEAYMHTKNARCDGALVLASDRRKT